MLPLCQCSGSSGSHRRLRTEYNHHRPHSSLGYRTPAEFTAQEAATQQPPAPSRIASHSDWYRFWGLVIHSHYERQVRDLLPLSSKAVWLKLSVRRFRCRDVTCAQRIFVERLPRIAAAHARCSRQLRTTLTQVQVGLLFGGEAGSRLARSLRMAASPDTLLRLIRLHPVPAGAGPRIVGVDDWAVRKGQRYGTILVDLERNVSIDRLPDRAAETLSSWLRSHPSIALITRDRFPEYAQGARDGAPQSCQIADRWHLLKNLRETLERLLKRMYRRLRVLPALTMPTGQAMGEQPRPLRPLSANQKVNREVIPSTHES
jgi:transposase